MTLSICHLNSVHWLLLVVTISFVLQGHADPVTNATLPNDTEDQPMETQSAQCTITAGDVQASAQATISKKLEGVCGSKQMAKSFEILEARLTIQLNQIRTMILAMHSAPQIHAAAHTPYVGPAIHNNQYMNQQYGQKSMPPPTQQQYPIDRAYQQYIPPPYMTPPVSSAMPILQEIQTTTKSAPDPVTSTTLKPAIYTRPTTIGPEITTNGQHIVTLMTPNNITERTLNFRPVQLKSLGRLLRPKIPQRSGPRDFEVHRFNNTILSGDEIRIFTYYWRIEKFTMKLKSNVTLLSSPIFSISGLHLKVNARLNHLNRDYLLLQLESVPEEQVADDSNIVLETGRMFKAIETKKLFRHKIVILDQETPTTDLISQEFFNTNEGFPVPNSAITAGPYAKDNNLLIKVVIYL